MLVVFELILKVWEDNHPWEWALAGTTACLVLALSIVARRWIRRRYAELAQTPERELAEVPLEIASKTSTAFLLVASLFPGFYTLALPGQVRHGLTVIFTVIGFWQLGVWGSEAVRAWFLSRRRAGQGIEPGTTSGLAVLAFVARIGVWAVIALLMLDNLGVNVTTLVAGLGVGGIAIALAVQNVLGDLFASLSIALDRPFVVGDLIVLGEFSGTVEQIGVKSTRLRSVNGEQIIISNADLLRAQLRNFGRMDQRRVLFTINVSYETPRDKLKRIPTLIRAAIESADAARFDRSHFSRFGAYALEFETAYWVLSSDYARYMDVQQSIYLSLHESFEREGIELAYPTQKLWLAQMPLEKPRGVGDGHALQSAKAVQLSDPQ